LNKLYHDGREILYFLRCLLKEDFMRLFQQPHSP
jgi:hypothetical protein